MSASARPVTGRSAWVGRDLAQAGRLRPRLGGRALAWLLTTALLCALALAALRIDILRSRYALAEAIRTENALQEELSRQTAAVEALRDPMRLARLAQQRGFGRPERILELQAPQARARKRPQAARSEPKASEVEEVSRKRAEADEREARSDTQP